MKKYKVLVLFGEGGSGKDTIVNWLYKAYPDHFHKVISYTTRPARYKERKDVDYHFTSPSQFQELERKDYFLETSIYNNHWQYGTCIKDFKEDKVNLCVLDPNGVRKFARNEEFDCVFIKVEVPALVRLDRMMSRIKKDYSDESIAEVCRRFYKDFKDFEIFNEDLKYLDNLKDKVFTFYNTRDIDFGFNNLLNIDHLKDFVGLNK